MAEQDIPMWERVESPESLAPLTRVLGYIVDAGATLSVLIVIAAPFLSALHRR